MSLLLKLCRNDTSGLGFNVCIESDKDVHVMCSFAIPENKNKTVVDLLFFMWHPGLTSESLIDKMLIINKVVVLVQKFIRLFYT